MDAAYEIISWDKPVISIQSFCRKHKKEINLPLMNILMEALQQKDEKEAQNGTTKAPRIATS